ncbi:Retrovirus-related Pol polyprotein from transposon [Dictyocoela muelleri]|nr:Retrovirus-related Pol polyprotein from transposon [Dictyocoela muelleri]
MKSGYYQVKIKDESRKYTAFWVENTKYEWNRMPFGLTNAPKTFQRVMDSLFSNLNFVKVYLEDLVIYSRNQKEHDTHLETVFRIINDNNLKINFDKSQFYKESVLFFGHYISKDGITADTSPIHNFSVKDVKTKKKVQKIIGFLNYFKNYIPNYSEKTLILTEMLSKENKVVWTAEKEKKTKRNTQIN